MPKIYLSEKAAAQLFRAAACRIIVYVFSMNQMTPLSLKTI
jgi:hypothetical protein